MINDQDIEAAMLERLPAAFRTKILVEPDSCWWWTASRNNTGYGTFRFGDKVYTAHRFLYEVLFGPQPGLDIDHLCRIRGCVNPAHLEPVNRKENVRRALDRFGRGNGKKTHCKNGHLLEDENLEIVIDTDGQRHRRCIICRNATARLFRARRKVHADIR